MPLSLLRGDLTILAVKFYILRACRVNLCLFSYWKMQADKRIAVVVYLLNYVHTHTFFLKLDVKHLNNLRFSFFSKQLDVKKRNLIS